jgi:hypothetical protein
VVQAEVTNPVGHQPQSGRTAELGNLRNIGRRAGVVRPPSRILAAWFLVQRPHYHDSRAPAASTCRTSSGSGRKGGAAVQPHPANGVRQRNFPPKKPPVGIGCHGTPLGDTPVMCCFRKRQCGPAHRLTNAHTADYFPHITEGAATYRNSRAEDVEWAWNFSSLDSRRRQFHTAVGSAFLAVISIKTRGSILRARSRAVIAMMLFRLGAVRHPIRHPGRDQGGCRAPQVHLPIRNRSRSSAVRQHAVDRGVYAHCRSLPGYNFCGPRGCCHTTAPMNACFEVGGSFRILLPAPF